MIHVRIKGNDSFSSYKTPTDIPKDGNIIEDTFRMYESIRVVAFDTYGGFRISIPFENIDRVIQTTPPQKGNK
jgi:hypothetical protein